MIAIMAYVTVCGTILIYDVYEFLFVLCCVVLCCVVLCCVVLCFVFTAQDFIELL